MDQLKSLIRTIPDFPKPGIQFRDITTLIQDPWGFKRAIDEFVTHYRYSPIDKVVAIESRGFVIGGALAHHLNCGMVMARKKGKLPWQVERLGGTVVGCAFIIELVELGGRSRLTGYDVLTLVAFGENSSVDS